MSSHDKALTRRRFVAGATALTAAAAAAPTLSGLFSQGEEQAAWADGDERLVWGHCAINCPGRCAIKSHVVGDELTQVETYSRYSDDITSKDDADIQPRACTKGRTYRKWVNHPDRLAYPMKRVGERGFASSFERCSWDEALQLVATKYKQTLEEYGPLACYYDYGAGVSCTTSRCFQRLMALNGGWVGYYGSYSTAEISWITSYVYDAMNGSGSSLSAARDSDLILMFGTSPVETRQGGAVSNHDYVRMREQTKGKIYVIDPRFNDSIAGHSDTWLPINPGTDAALVAAIAHELIANGQIDLEFVHKYAVGFDEQSMPDTAKGMHKSYTDYIMGTGYDMVEKTPEWAAPITGIPASTIKTLANEIGTCKALYVDQGWGPQRRAQGELTAWAIEILPVLVGMIGKPGTSNGCREGSYSPVLSSLPANINPGTMIKDLPEGVKPVPEPMDKSLPVNVKISVFNLVDAIDHGHAMTEKADGVTGIDHLPYDIKFVIHYAGNCITNDNCDVNWVHDTLRAKGDDFFMVGIDVNFNDSLKYCDVILPDKFRLEQVSLIATGGDDGYIIAGQPMFKQDKFERTYTCWQMAEKVADLMGLRDQYTGIKADGSNMTEEDWIKQMYEEDRKNPMTAQGLGLPAYEQLMGKNTDPQGDSVEGDVLTFKNPNAGGNTIAMQAFVQDPKANPLMNDSGKINIYSAALDTYIQNHDFPADDKANATPIPSYAREWWGADTRTDDYPLCGFDFHYRGRQHSAWGNVDTLLELNPQELWINPADAQSRGIASGDTVRIKSMPVDGYSSGGVATMQAKVTPKVIPGSVCFPHAAWHNADMSGATPDERLDSGGCDNTLSSHRGSMYAKGNATKTYLVQISKA